MKRIYTARHATDAHLLADLLEAEGIAVGTLNTNYGWRSASHISDPPSVWIVEESDFEKAMKFVEEYSRHESSESAATWQCPICGEHIEEQFSTCWKCSPGAVESGNATPSQALESDGSEFVPESAPTIPECPECGAPALSHRSWCPEVDTIGSGANALALVKKALGLIMVLLGLVAFALGGFIQSIGGAPTLLFISGVIVVGIGVALALGIGET